jgi:hypothetical protein
VETLEAEGLHVFQPSEAGPGRRRRRGEVTPVSDAREEVVSDDQAAARREIDGDDPF